MGAVSDTSVLEIYVYQLPWPVSVTMTEYGVISQMQKERQVQMKGHTWFSLYHTAQA